MEEWFWEEEYFSSCSFSHKLAIIIFPKKKEKLVKFTLEKKNFPQIWLIFLFFGKIIIANFLIHKSLPPPPPPPQKTRKNHPWKWVHELLLTVFKSHVQNTYMGKIIYVHG